MLQYLSSLISYLFWALFHHTHFDFAMQDNEELGLVQARWSFVNKDENLLTRLQNVNLTFHFEVEQQVNGIFINFFGFNGTAGVWRIKALEDSGGWLERTTVEDMDIAVRAHLRGWKFIFLNDVEVNLPTYLSPCVCFYASYSSVVDCLFSGLENANCGNQHWTTLIVIVVLSK